MSEFPTPQELISFLHDEQNPDWDTKDALLYSFVRVAKSANDNGTTAHTMLIAALWPGLDRLSKKLTFPEESEDGFSDFYSFLLEEVQSWDLQKKRKIAPNLLLNVRKRVLGLYQEIKETECLHFRPGGQCLDDLIGGDYISGIDIPIEEAVESSLEEAEISSILDRLVALGVLIPQDCVLITLHVFQEHALKELAVSYGLDYKVLCKRYERAIKRLKDFFGDEQGFRRFLES